MNARPPVELNLKSLVERLQRDDLTKQLPIQDSEIGLTHYTVRWSCDDDQIIRCKIERIYFENKKEQDLQKVITVFTDVLKQLGFVSKDKTALNDFATAVNNYNGYPLACGRVALGDLAHNYVTINITFKEEDYRLLNGVRTLAELDELDKIEAARRSPVVRDNSPDSSFNWSCLFCCPRKQQPALELDEQKQDEDQRESYKSLHG